MGLFDMIARAFDFSGQKARILVVGLDNSGKTTLINHLKPKKTNGTAEVTPTVGFQVEEFARNNIQFTIYDMSGQGRYRGLWESYYAEVQAVIFVIDSTDRLRMVVAKEELDQLLTHEDIKDSNIPLLFFANKNDCTQAMGHLEVSDMLDLNRIRQKPWQIKPSNAITGDGILEGIEWLCSSIKRSSRK